VLQLHSGAAIKVVGVERETRRWIDRAIDHGRETGAGDRCRIRDSAAIISSCNDSSDGLLLASRDRPTGQVALIECGTACCRDSVG